MIFHGVNLLSFIFKLEVLGVLVSAGVVLFVPLWMLDGALLSVFFKDFKLLLRVPWAIQ